MQFNDPQVPRLSPEKSRHRKLGLADYSRVAAQARGHAPGKSKHYPK
jgi:hypothetical protein